MIEITRVTLQNEMDLILANKRAMKLAELSGLSIAAQTTFATAISEVSRNAIEKGKNSCLCLGIENILKRDKYIVARISDKEATFISPDGLEYAKKLASKFLISNTDAESSVELQFYIPGAYRLLADEMETWKSYFMNEPPVSPYEEIKRKNEQLQLVANKLLESESQYKTLTNSLPIHIFSLNLNNEIIYANEWLTNYAESTIEYLNEHKWKNLVHPDDYSEFSVILNNKIISKASVIKTQSRLKKASTNEYKWHLVSVTPVNDEKENLLYWIGFLVDINAQMVVEKTLQENRKLAESQILLKKQEEWMKSDIEELNRSNLELSQFAFIASHDLQEPLRKIILYSDYLLNMYQDKVNEKGVEYLKSMRSASGRMRNLIKDLLSYSQINNKQLELETIDLNKIATNVLQDLQVLITETNASIKIQSLPHVEADGNLIGQLFSNLISNSIKYSRENVRPEILIDSKQENPGEVILYFKDNGIGFDEKYIDKIFTLFQRLHGNEIYKGTGLGLAICRKIVQLHNGSIEARGEPGNGATFIVTLPVNYKSIMQ